MAQGDEAQQRSAARRRELARSLLGAHGPARTWHFESTFIEESDCQCAKYCKVSESAEGRAAPLVEQTTRSGEADLSHISVDGSVLVPATSLSNILGCAVRRSEPRH